MKSVDREFSLVYEGYSHEFKVHNWWRGAREILHILRVPIPARCNGDNGKHSASASGAGRLWIFLSFFFFLPRLWENRVCNLLSLVFDRYFWIVVRIGLRYDISYQKENKRTNFIYKTSAQKGQTLLRTISLLQIKITFDNWRLRWTIVLLVLLVYWWYY